MNDNNSQFMPGGSDGLLVERKLRVFVFFLATVFIGFFAVRTQNLRVALIAPLIPVGIYLLPRPDLVCMYLLLAGYARLTLPGYTIQFILSFCLVGSVILQSCVRHVRLHLKTSDKWLLAFFGVMLSIIAVRGLGLRVGGGMVWGGRKYIEITLLIFIYIAAGTLQLSEKNGRRLVYGTLVAVLVSLSIFLVAKVTGHRSVLTSLLGIGRASVDAITDINLEEGVTRYIELSHFARLLWPFAFVLQKKTLRRIIGGVSLIMMGLAGFRSELFYTAATTALWFFMRSNAKSKYIFKLGVFALLAWGLIVVASPFLSPQAQRVVSWVPGASVEYAVAQDATQSVDWRVEIWKYCWREVPAYLLIGKGILFDITSLAWLRSGFYGTPEFFFATHAYHSGPLTLLLDFGAAGFVTMVLFFLTSSREFFARTKSILPGDVCSRYALFLACAFFVRLVGYFFIYGDMGVSFERLALYGVVIRLLTNPDFHNTKKQKIAQR